MGKGVLLGIFFANPSLFCIRSISFGRHLLILSRTLLSYWCKNSITPRQLSGRLVLRLLRPNHSSWALPLSLPWYPLDLVVHPMMPHWGTTHIVLSDTLVHQLKSMQPLLLPWEQRVAARRGRAFLYLEAQPLGHHV